MYADDKLAGREPCELPVRFYLDWLGGRRYYCAKHYDIQIDGMKKNMDNSSFAGVLKVNNV